VSKGLDIFGQGSGGRGVVVARRCVGRVQVANGANGQSKRVVGECVAWLVAGVGGVGCRRWEGCQKWDKPIRLAIGRIECGRAARENIGCRVVFGGLVHCGLVPGMMRGERIR